MAKTRSRGEEVRSLTHVELELMTIVWRLGEASVAEVIASLPRERELAYTSVSTILRILESKGVLEARREGRGHIYVPVLSRNAYEARAVQDVVTRVFEGAPVALVRQLVDNVELSAEDLREIRKLLARIKESK
jgi:predicted transcriptional regulator